MNEPSSGKFRERVLLLLATSRDADLARVLLEKNAIDAHACNDPHALERDMEHGAGAVVIAEESLRQGLVQSVLARVVERQPPWSDLPVLVVARPGANSIEVGEAIATLGNVTLLERPLRVAALVSTLRMMLRARRRQYEIRDHLRELERARDAEANAARRKDEFLAMLAHELRNPLAPVRNALHLLEVDDRDPRRRSELRHMIDRQVTHMVRLVDDLLESSRLSRGMIALHREPLDLAATLRATVDALDPLAGTRGFQLEADIPAESFPMSGDPVRLAQVFGNLLNNAFRYGRPGGCIRVRLSREGDQAVVAIEDDGIGIDPQLLPRVFELFTQGERGTSGLQEGLGIGLALVRTLVELHGGTATAHSDGLGLGACFRVRLPLQAEAGLPAVPAGTATASASRAAAGLRVLVADDNVDAANSLGMVLEALGAAPCVVHDGAAALRAADSFDPDVLLLDIGMPGMDGYEVARRLRAEPRFRDLLLVAVSGWSDIRDVHRTREAGFDHHLAKPVDVSGLAGILGLRQARPPVVH